ncbi:MAG: type II secretion system protein [Planctomycetota bacterium]
MPKHSPPSRRSAFSLIELLVTIFIIALLIGLSFPVVASFKNSAKAYTAQSQLTGMAGAADEYNIVTQEVVLPKGDTTNPFGGANYVVDFTDSPTNNTLGWFVYQAGAVPSVDSLIRIAGKSSLTYNGSQIGSIADVIADINAGGSVDDIRLEDAWETPVRYAGGTLHTSVSGTATDPTSDDDYLPIHPTAFFASAGPDGLWGAVDANNQPDPSVDVDGDGEPDAADNLYSFEID